MARKKNSKPPKKPPGTSASCRGVTRTDEKQKKEMEDSAAEQRKQEAANRDKDLVTSLWNSMTMQQKKDALKIKISDLVTLYTSGLIFAAGSHKVFSKILSWYEETKSWTYHFCCDEPFFDRKYFRYHVVAQHLSSLNRRIYSNMLMDIDLEQARKEDKNVKGSDHMFIYADDSIILGDHFLNPVQGADVFLQWLYSTEEQFMTWYNKDNEKDKKQDEMLQTLKQEYCHLLRFLDRKCSSVNNEEIMRSIQDLCLEESKRRKGEYTPKSYESVLRERRGELIEPENIMMMICNRFQIDVITKVLEQVEAQPLDNDTYINEAIQKQQKQLSDEISKINARISQSISVMQQLILELETVSLQDYESIFLTLANLHLRNHFEDLATKIKSKKAKGSKDQLAKEDLSFNIFRNFVAKINDWPEQKKLPLIKSSSTPRGNVQRVGLKNDAGANNCFLNVIVQSLWHLRRFRDEIMRSPIVKKTHAGNMSVVCALQKTFTSMRLQSLDSKIEAVDPTVLRKAISDLGRDSNSFQEGQMNDASEVLIFILKSLHDSLSSSDSNVESIESSCTGSWECASNPCLVHHFFGMNIIERKECSCGVESKCEKYTSLCHNINATALRTMKLRDTESCFDELLNVEMKREMTCNLVDGGCGNLNYINHYLSGPPPRVFTTVLGWQKSSESADDIAGTLAALSTEIDISVVYPGLDSNTHNLVSVVCYSQVRHYIVFVYHNDGECWVMYDDTVVQEIGVWADVLTWCKEKCFQPQVLFFEASNNPEPSH